jgi:hypothetical protein
MDQERWGERAQERPTASKTSAGGTPLRAAFVGLGWWGRALAEATERSTDLAVAAGCSTVASETEAFAERFRCPTMHGYERVLHDPSIDAVVLATPHSLHAGQVEAAARAGKHVFVEKPFTLSNADARAAVRACDAAGRVLAVGHNRRLLPQLGLIARALGEGRCGSILHVEANFSTPEALGFAQGHWRTSRAECPGGGMTVLGIHVIDWLHALFGPITEVSAIFSRRAVATDSDDTAHAQAADCPETDSVRPRLTLTTRDGATEQIPCPTSTPCAGSSKPGRRVAPARRAARPSPGPREPRTSPCSRPWWYRPPPEGGRSAWRMARPDGASRHSGPERDHSDPRKKRPRGPRRSPPDTG